LESSCLKVFRRESIPASLAQLDRALWDATLARQVPGVVAMAATDNGIIYEGAFGSRHLGQGPAMSYDTVFRIASMIKVVTSVAAMHLKAFATTEITSSKAMP
jgi:methyl acetate hydrolase